MLQKKIKKQICLSIVLLYSVTYQTTNTTPSHDYVVNLAKNAKVDINADPSDTGLITIGNSNLGDDISLISPKTITIGHETSGGEIKILNANQKEILLENISSSTISGKITLKIINNNDLSDGSGQGILLETSATGANGQGDPITIKTSSNDNSSAGNILIISRTQRSSTLSSGSGNSGNIDIKSTSYNGNSGNINIETAGPNLCGNIINAAGGSINNFYSGGSIIDDALDQNNQGNIFMISNGNTMYLPSTTDETLVNNPTHVYKDNQLLFAKVTEQYFTVSSNTRIKMFGRGSFKLNNIPTSFDNGDEFDITPSSEILFTQANTYAAFLDNETLTWNGDASYNVTPQGNTVTSSIVLSTKDYTIYQTLENALVLASDNIILDGSIILSGLTSPAGSINTYGLSVDTDGKIYMSTGSTPSFSSRRYKDNIKALNDEESAQIYDLNTYSFNYKSQVDATEYGLIVEELHENRTLKSAVRYNSKGQPDAISYNSIMIAMLKEMQKLKARVDQLENAQWDIQARVR
jgi:hypothetical protein